MDLCGRSLLVVICTCFTLRQVYGFTSHLALPVNIKINTGSSAGLQISISTGIDCQNGGTPINSNTCLCPSGLFGKHCNHSLYFSFDTLENLVLMEGTEQGNFDPQIEGQFSSGVITDKDQRQWFDLGFHPEVCVTNRYGCGSAGSAVSLWLRLLDCPENGGGIITTKASSRHSGFSITCPSPGNRRYLQSFPGGFFQSDEVPGRIFRWLHILINFIEPNNGEGFRVYHDGELIQNVTFKDNGLPFVSNDSNIVIGRSFTEQNRFYSSVRLDEVLLFNRNLTGEEIAMLNQF